MNEECLKIGLYFNMRTTQICLNLLIGYLY